MLDPIVEHVKNTNPTLYDRDIDDLSLTQIREELIALRNAIRLHRDEKGHDRCWVDDGRLYGALPDKIGANSELPQWPEFQANCERFWKGRQHPISERDGPQLKEKE